MFRLSIHATILVSVVLASSTAMADLYLDFGDRHQGLPSTFGAGAGTPGAWNDIISLGSTGGLLDTTGAVSSMSVNLSASAPNGSGSIGSNNDARLLNDFFFANGGVDWSVTVSGLDNGFYNVFYYDPTSTGVGTGPFTINGAAASPLASSAGGSLILTQGDTWQVMTGVDVTSNTLTLASTGTTSFRGLSGLQLVAIPEPTSLTLLGLPLFGYVLRRRR